MANREKIYNISQIETLASMKCTDQEIARVLGCSLSAFRKLKRERKDIDEAVKDGSNKGSIGIRRKMFQMAMDGDRTILIWLSKVELGYREETTIKISFAGCKTNLDKINKVNDAIAKGKITVQAGKMFVDSLKTAITEEVVQMIETIHELKNNPND